MYPFSFHQLQMYIQHTVSFCGVLIIFFGVIVATLRFLQFYLKGPKGQNLSINKIRLNLGLVLCLGLEFIVAADLIGTTTAPDYYSVGIVASIVIIRTLLSLTLNHEINDLRNIENSGVAQKK